MMECKQLFRDQTRIQLSLSHRSSEHALSPMPCPLIPPTPLTSKVAKDRYQIFKRADVYRDLSRQISPAILFRYSRLFCEASGFQHAPVWSVPQRQSLQIAALWRNEAVGRAGVMASARETSSQRPATIEHILICQHLIFVTLDENAFPLSLPG